jgi:SNF family Na+-dependent transporter
MESLIGNIQVEFKRRRSVATAITSLVLIAGSLFFCFGNGQALIGALAPMVLGNNYLIGGIAEIVVFMYVAKAIRQDPIWQSRSGTICFYLLRFAIPAILATILVSSIAQEVVRGFHVGEFVRWGWLLVAIALSGFLASKRSLQTAALGQGQ